MRTGGGERGQKDRRNKHAVVSEEVFPRVFMRRVIRTKRIETAVVAVDFFSQFITIAT